MKPLFAGSIIFSIFAEEKEGYVKKEFFTYASPDTKPGHKLFFIFFWFSTNYTIKGLTGFDSGQKWFVSM